MKTIKTNNKEFPIRIHEAKSPKYVFVTHHGVISNKSSWVYFERWVEDNAIVVSYDARSNGANTFLKASRFASTYVNDLKDVVLWTKKKWPNLKIIVLGSSWGAAVVICFMKKYADLVYKGVSWSLPMTIKERTTQDKKTKSNKHKDGLIISETSTIGYAWKFFVMLVFNYNSRSLTNINVKKVTSNISIHRINKMTKKNLSTPIKLFYSAYKTIVLAPKNLKTINRELSNKLLYIQSTKDSFIVHKKWQKIKKHTGKGVQIIELNEGHHAFQWELKDNLNNRVFQKMWDFCEKK